MMLKKSKQDVLNEINVAASNAISSTLQGSLHGSMKLEVGSISWAIQKAVADAVEAGFSKLMDNIYSDTEFENDMTLR